MPGLERYVRPEFEQFSNVASSELTLDQWLALARRLNEIFATDAGISGLVVTSGTDTLVLSLSTSLRASRYGGPP